MAFTVTDFIKEAQSGARPNLFLAQVRWPEGVSSPLAQARIPFLIKATNIPAMTLGTINVPFMGRIIKVAGDRTFEEWSTTVINDEQFLVRSRLEAWQDAINGLRSNRPNFDAPLAYRTDAKVTQFNHRGIPIRTYEFENIWPQTISSIDLSWETPDTLEEFTVTWSYDYFTTSGAVDAIDNLGQDIGQRIRDVLGG